MANTARKGSATSQKKADEKSTMKVVNKDLKKTTVEDRIENLEKLQVLTGKHVKIRESFHNLEKFNLANDQDGIGLRLSDGQGHEFKTSNTNAITAVREALKKVMTEMLSETEKQIIEFEV